LLDPARTRVADGRGLRAARHDPAFGVNEQRFGVCCALVNGQDLVAHLASRRVKDFRLALAL
jgi:hypothetical protein